MPDYLLLKFAHIMALVYWLGGDLGTFLASRHVINRELSPEARHVALRIMLACDMGPKLAMPLILPLGLQLAYMSGSLAISIPALIAAWVACLYWFGVVLVLFTNEGKPFTVRLSTIDFYFRIAVVLVLLGYGGSLLLGAETPRWVAWKLLVFAAMVACGIAIRLHLKPFPGAFGAIMSGGPNEDANRVMALSVQRCRPFVWMIWGGLFLNTALGIHLVN